MPKKTSIVINADYGGFGLSHKAVMRIAELKGIKLYAYVNPVWNYKEYVPYNGDGNSPIIYYFTKKLTDKDNTNDNEFWKKYSWNDRDLQRDDLTLVQVVKELKKEANGYCANLKVVNIPADVNWEIEEYDGAEWVSEVHRTWG